MKRLHILRKIALFLVILIVVMGEFSTSQKKTYAFSFNTQGNNTQQDDNTKQEALEKANELYNKSVELRKKGLFDEAVISAKQALEIREKFLEPTHTLITTSCYQLGILYREKGEYEKAELLLKRAVEDFEKVLGPNNASVGASYNTLGNFYREIGEYEKAEFLLKKGLVISENALGPNHPDVGTCYSNLGNFYREIGEYEKAEPLLQRDLAISEKFLSADHPDLAISYNNLGIFYSAKGEYEKAESLFRRTLEIRERTLGPNHPSVGTSCNNLGDMFKQKREFEKAEPLLKRALEIREKAFGLDHPFVGVCCNNLGDLYSLKGEYEKAEPLLKRALEIKEKFLSPSHPSVSVSYYNLGDLYRLKGEYEKAEPLFKRALDAFEKAFGSDRPIVARNYYNLSNFYQLKGDINQAIIYNKKGNESREKEFLHNLNTGSEKQKLLYINKTASEQDMAISLSLKTAPKNKQAAESAITVILQRKGRALDAMTNAIANLRLRASKEDLQLLDELATAKSSLSSTLLAGVNKIGVEKYKEKRKLLENQVEELENKISARSSEFKISNVPINLETVQQAIPNNALLIEFVTYRPYDVKTEKSEPPHYAVYTLDKSGKLQWTDLGEAAEINKLIEEFRQLLTKQPSKKLSDIDSKLKPKAKELYKLIIQPIRQFLGNTKRLLISPDGNLNLIPFDALIDEKSKYLVENYEISYLTSGRDLLRLQNGIKSKQKPIVIADPNYGNGDGTKIGNFFVAGERLKYTADEANQIKQMLNLQADEVLVEDQATKAALKQLQRPEILHIATHGFFLKEQDGSTDSRRTNIKSGSSQSQLEKLVTEKDVEEFKLTPLLKSGLLLAGANKGDGDNGVLTALEATTLDLWGTKLVVLSACDTGVGEIKNGDGVYGLRRALVLAGSESQLMSLWPVSDSGTKDLMIKYYQALKNGEGRCSGLRKVRLEFLKDPKRSHPYFWASFIQSGEWANLDGKR